MTERAHPLSFSLSASTLDEALSKAATIIAGWYGGRDVVFRTSTSQSMSLTGPEGEAPLGWTVDVEAWLEAGTVTGPPPPPPKPARPTLG